jgi:hypothetical protein
MRSKLKGRALRVALATVAAPVAGWALEQAARRAETRDTTSPTSRRLRQGAEFVQHLGRGPLADRLGRRPATTRIRDDREPQRTDQHGG